MGEIRSTLDIIMEKTKGLTISEEERKAIERNETEGKVRGLFQRFLDGALSLEKFQGEITAMEGEKQSMALAFLKEECRCLDPDGDMSPYLRVLETILKANTALLKKAVSTYHAEMDQRKRSWETRSMEGLRNRGISGSALVPNLRADPAWIAVVSEEKAALHKKLASIVR